MTTTEPDSTSPAPLEAVSPQAETIADNKAADSSPTQAADRGLAAGTRVGKYVIQDLLGRGGMGCVYLARHVELGRQIALKVLTEVSERRLLRFQREARAIANLKHPHLVTLYEVGSWQGLPFLAMEYVAGEELGAFMVQEPSLQLKVGLLAQACFAVEEMHRQGVLHRDLKPGNILVQSDPLEVKVLDFGLALSTDGEDPTLTRSGDVLGTPAYMSPEQAEGRGDIDARSDVYALGAILYELLTDRRPFDGATPLKVLHNLLHQPLVPPDKLADVPGALSRICLKAMQRHPKDRFASAAALGEDLHAWLEGREPSARRVSTWKRARRFARRHPSGVAVCGLLLLTAVLLLSLGRSNRLMADARALRNAESRGREFANRLDRKLEVAEAQLQFLGRSLSSRLPGNADSLAAWPQARLAGEVLPSMAAFLEVNPWIYGSALAGLPFRLDRAREQLILYLCRGPDGIEQPIASASYNYLTEPWFREPLRRAGGFWTAPFFDAGMGEVWMVTHARPFLRGPETAGVVTVDIALGTFHETLLDFDLGGGYACLLDNRGGALTSWNLDAPIGQPAWVQRQFPELEMAAGAPQVEARRDPRTRARCVLVNLPLVTTDWRVVLMLPLAQLR